MRDFGRITNHVRRREGSLAVALQDETLSP